MLENLVHTGTSSRTSPIPRAPFTFQYELGKVATSQLIVVPRPHSLRCRPRPPAVRASLQ